MIVSLQWPDDVVEQFLDDRGDNPAFLQDYRDVDLSGVVWGAEATTAEELRQMPAGASDNGCIEAYAANPDHWVWIRHAGIHEDVAQRWATLGTWKRPPILIDRRLLAPSHSGLQVVEGRTRVGVLRGRLRQGSLVARQYQTWLDAHPRRRPHTQNPDHQGRGRRPDVPPRAGNAY